MTWSIQEGRGILELYRAVEGHSPIRQTNTENILERSKKHRPKQVTSIVFSAFWVGSSDHHPHRPPDISLVRLLWKFLLGTIFPPRTSEPSRPELWVLTSPEPRSRSGTTESRAGHVVVDRFQPPERRPKMAWKIWNQPDRA